MHRFPLINIHRTRSWITPSILSLWVSLGLFSVPLDARPADEPIQYVVSLTAPQTQMVDISIRVPNVTTETLDVALPVWRPGRYTVLDPAGTVRQVRAFTDADQPLPIVKTDKTTWRVTTNGEAAVRVEYRVYANSLGDRTRHVDDTHAFLSGSAVFFYVPDRRDDPIRVRIEAPAEWKIASGLEPAPDDDRTLVAANYDVLIDSPIEVGLHDVIEFDVDGKPHEIVIWGPADYDAEQLEEDFRKIVRSQADIFGDLPYERYVFLIHVGSGMGGGTEHLNSTVMQTRRSSLEDKTAYKRFLGLVSHEFFHTWNVKQLRPAGIQPYDYTRENYTKLLWVCEGTTSYYDDLTLTRAGLIKTKDYLKRLGKAIGSMRDRPGSRVQSLEDSSFDAWTKFNHPNPDSVNSTVSFYGNGALVSLMLDMELRLRTENRVSLDTLMRAMYKRFPLGEGGFTPQDLIDMADELSGTDFDPFFAWYVRGTVDPDFESALRTVGLELTFKPNSKDDDEHESENGDEEEGDDEEGDESEEDVELTMKAYIGLQLSSGSGGRTTVRAVLSDGPAYLAGLASGDEIVAFDGRSLPAGELDKRLENHEPGDTVTLHVMRRDRLRTFELTLGSKPDGKWTLKHIEAPVELQIAAYESWIGQDWPGSKKEETETESEPAAENK